MQLVSVFDLGGDLGRLRNRPGLWLVGMAEPQVSGVGQFSGPAPGPFRKAPFAVGLKSPGDPFDHPFLVPAAGRLAKGLDILVSQPVDRHRVHADDR